MLLLSALSSVSSGLPSAGSKALEEVSTWVSYYGAGRLNDLARFDLIDIDGGRNIDNYMNYVASDVVYLKTAGRIVLSYQSIGTAENWRWYWPLVEASWLIAPVEHWSNEWYVDCREQGWQDLILYQAILELLEKGFDGLYLDNIDVAETFPSTAPGVVELISRIRETYPWITLIAQNGLYVMEDIYTYIDGLAKEDASSTYDWDTGRYVKVPQEESDRLLTELTEWERRGLVVFTLDYAVYRTMRLAKYDYERSWAHGLAPYAANIDLDRIYFWPWVELGS